MDSITSSQKGPCKQVRPARLDAGLAEDDRSEPYAVPAGYIDMFVFCAVRDVIALMCLLVVQAVRESVQTSVWRPEPPACENLSGQAGKSGCASAGWSPNGLSSSAP